jgi:hypothetical protein
MASFGSRKEFMGSITTRELAPLRRAACALAGMLAIAMPAAYAESAIGQSRAQAGIDVRIVIPAFVRVKARSDPGVIPIAEADVARGYVDVDDATSLVLTSNSPSGFAVSVAFDERLVSRVAVRIGGHVLEAGPQASALHVQAPKMIEKPLRMGYRLFLVPGAAAGTYRWPVVLSFMPTAV